MRLILILPMLVLMMTTGAFAVESASDRLRSLFQREWDWTMQQNPLWASSLGDRRWNDKWDDGSLAAVEARNAHSLDVIKELRAIERGPLSDADKLNYDLFLDQLQRGVEENSFAWYLLPLNQRDGIQTASTFADNLRFETVKDYEDYVARLRAFPARVDQTIEVMREGVRKRMAHPKVIMQRVPAQIEKQIVDDPTKSDWFKPLANFPPAINEGDRKRLSAAASDALRDAVIPAYRKFGEFFAKEYLPACLDEVGIWQLPRGDEMYAMFVRQYTTTQLTPDQVHELGLAEVKRINAEMDSVMQQTDFKGSRAEFFNFLRSDPRFFYKDGDALLSGTRALCKRIDPKLTKLFKTLPRMPYGVEPIPMAVAPDTTTAYYNEPAADGSRAGTYYVNLYKPETRPKWEMVALTLHEAVPGHHLQIARAMELGELPNFRRYGGYTAYVEGWALYCEALGEEIGMYDDPYDRFGRLTYEMWRAVRLVVDTGIHAKHWTRQQAIDYFKANAAKTELDITNEVDRYIAWPGQALAYKVGELKIKELRKRAEQKLGSKFDVREFHDLVLSQGAVPLDELERMVDRWIASQSSR